ncbi:MAG: M48 family metalloprotease [Gemmatimonadetes bacterium]|nr:M48 family metalloprotease [Gemmatimonadota bacterium]
MKIKPGRLIRRWEVLVLSATLTACATNPVTGRRQLALVSESQEIQMGQQAAQEVRTSIGLVENPALQAYVQRIGAALAARSERPTLPWSFQVVDDATPNAFALPGGPIFVTRGLLALMDSEAELASVLGHEIGHVTARHSVSQISRAQLAQIGLVLGQVLVPQTQALGGVAESGVGLLFLKYGRDAERQADDLGFKYALTDGYDVREMADVFEALQRASADKQEQGRLPGWLATHPGEPERIQAVAERVAALTTPVPTRTGATEFLNSIDNLVYGENPRAGFFRGSTFYHPDLQFRIDFPQGWQTQNLPQAVVAGSPRQDGVMQLTLANGGAQAAAQQFLGQQGIQPLQTSRQNIQGLPAVVSYFQAQIQQGQIRGLAGFIEHAGRTYQVLSYAPAPSFGAYDQEFQRALGSFRRLTDPQILGMQPNRIDVVRLPQPMTLVEFNRRNPSVVPIEEIALLNQIENVGAQLPAGTLVKRVIGS